MNTHTFEDWVKAQLGLDDDQLTDINLIPTFEIFISRIELARRRGATDPLLTATAKSAGGNSRRATKAMIEQLGLEPPARRAMHRLMAGSPSGFDGLLRLFAMQARLKGTQRKYARRQVLTLLESAQAGRSRRHSSASCVARASAPYSMATPTTVTAGMPAPVI